jgi:hypothetical protein
LLFFLLIGIRLIVLSIFVGIVLEPADGEIDWIGRSVFDYAIDQRLDKNVDL